MEKTQFYISEIKKLVSDFAWIVHSKENKNIYPDKKIDAYKFIHMDKFKDSYFYYDSENDTAEFFDNKTGWTLCSDKLSFSDADKSVIWTGVEPERRNWPALLDIGVMGHCTTCETCRVYCYQKARDYVNRPDMPFETYKKILDEVKEHTWQVSMGGAGNFNFHADFERMMKYARDIGIVPNYTTAILLDDKQIEITKKYAGAVAISWHPTKAAEGKPFDNDYTVPQDYTLKSIQKSLSAGIVTNVHYVLSRESIKFAIDSLTNNLFPKGLYAVVFLRYKPVGYGKDDICILKDDDDTKKFFSIVNNWNPSEHNNLNIGFDSCMVPLTVGYNSNINPSSLLSCEAARQSMYFSPDGYGLPCSFGNQDKKWYVSGTVKSIWNSKLFSDFKKCANCPWVR